MSADFRKLSNFRVDAKSPKLEGLPFIVTTMFTEKFAKSAERLRHSLEEFELHFVLYRAPAVHRSISTQGTGDIEFCKPNFIRGVLLEYGLPVLYVDADVVFRDFPKMLLQLVQDQVDFSAYNWLADPANEAYFPTDAVVNGTVYKNDRFYRYSHSVDALDPTQLIVSGSAQFYTQDALPLLRAWLGVIDRFPSAADDECLDYAYNLVVEKDRLRTFWWPKEYCRYPWWILTPPIIDHPNWPAPPDASRNIGPMAGRSRVNMDNIKHRNPSMPRDCLIDTKRKCLVRLGEGRAVRVKEFADLWVAAQAERR